MIRIAALWRHPLKAHGREALDRVTLHAGQSMPYDRTWAVAHTQSKASSGAWASCANFTRGAGMPQLQAISATLDEGTERLTLRHPDLAELVFHPDRDVQNFLAWIAPLCPDARAQPADILRLDGRGYTDSPVPSISMMSHSSHSAVEHSVGAALDITRWRGNIWVEGAEAWDEFNWVGRRAKLGGATLGFDAPYTRCKSINANTQTGLRDLDLLAALDRFGHREFGIGCSVITGGDIHVGDTLELV